MRLQTNKIGARLAGFNRTVEVIQWQECRYKKACQKTCRVDCEGELLTNDGDVERDGFCYAMVKSRVKYFVKASGKQWSRPVGESHANSVEVEK